MERRGVWTAVLILCSLSSTMVNISATSRTTRGSVPKNSKNEYYKERLRRNLLANGLGSTPPMGYYSLFLSLGLIAVDS